MDSSSLGDKILDGEYDAFQWDWYVEPDPDGILGDFTCDQLGDLNDSWYCDAGYDAMYAQQGVEMDKDKRVADRQADAAAALRGRALHRHRRDQTGEAVRTDKWACFQPQPDPGGVWLFQYGGHNYPLLRPAAEAGDCDGTPTALGAVAATAAAAAPAPAAAPAAATRWAASWPGSWLTLVVVAACFWRLRRRRTGSDRANEHRRREPADPAGRRPQELRPLRLAKVLGAFGSLVFVLVVNFFLFRVLPATRRGRWAGTGSRPRKSWPTSGTSTASTSRCRSSSSPTCRTPSPATSATRCATGCRSAT